MKERWLGKEHGLRSRTARPSSCCASGLSTRIDSACPGPRSRSALASSRARAPSRTVASNEAVRGAGEACAMLSRKRGTADSARPRGRDRSSARRDHRPGMLSQLAFTVAIGFPGSRLFFVIEDSFESSGWRPAARGSTPWPRTAEGVEPAPSTANSDARPGRR